MRISEKKLQKLKGLTTATTLYVLTTTGGAQAMPLNITLLDAPEIASISIDINYDAGDDRFSVVGIASEIDSDGNRETPGTPITDGSFELSASILDGGILGSSGGTLTITGDIDAGDTTLLTGNLTEFGYPNDDSGDPLEFLFEVTGGVLAEDFGISSSTGGIILSQTDITPGIFLADFDNSGSGGQGLADTAPVPLPAAFWLFGASTLVFPLVGWRRNKR